MTSLTWLSTCSISVKNIIYTNIREVVTSSDCFNNNLAKVMGKLHFYILTISFITMHLYCSDKNSKLWKEFYLTTKTFVNPYPVDYLKWTCPLTLLIILHGLVQLPFLGLSIISFGAIKMRF